MLPKNPRDPEKYPEVESCDLESQFLSRYDPKCYKDIKKKTSYV